MKDVETEEIENVAKIKGDATGLDLAIPGQGRPKSKNTREVEAEIEIIVVNLAIITRTTGGRPLDVMTIIIETKSDRT